ncbi:hypothetical protein [Salinimicrobium xinjiangense]|uniref:hypothetical protein n=1 Tax=Salinimicrobium xinjiangense TaxID=438596 RepID=UPI000425FB69|nr:hypothetical protein [Salinimicrobium xinjiangense]
MKTKFYLPLMFLFFLGLTSCSIDDDNGEIGSVEAHLMGRWDLEGYTVNGTFMAAQGDILEFKTGGVVVWHSGEEEVTGNYTLSGNQLALNFPDGGDIFTMQTLNITTLLLYNEEEFDDVEGVDEVQYHFKKLPE